MLNSEKTNANALLQPRTCACKDKLCPSLDGEESGRLCISTLLKCNNVDFIGGSGICAEHSDDLKVLKQELAAKHGLNTFL